MNVKWMLKRIKNLSFSRIPTFVERVHKNSGKCKLSIYFDMATCALKYGAGYVDYTIFGMYNMSAAERRQLITREKNNNYVKYLNPAEHRKEFSEKHLFLKKYSDQIGRDWLYLPDADEGQIAAFFEKNPVFMAKTLDGMCGKGVEKLKVSDFGSVEELKAKLEADNQPLVEELITQHPEISRIHPHAINTVRICTLKDADGNAHIVFACMRFGRGESTVDNFNAGGMSAVVDFEKGVLMGRAIDKSGDLFAAHPDSNVTFDGVEIPFWKEAADTVLTAAKMSEHIRYVGWDVAITPTGPVLVEGNEFPGHDLFQLHGQLDENKGILPVFDAIVPYSEVLKGIKK